MTKNELEQASVTNIRITLPHHLCTLANTGSEVSLSVQSPVTQCTILDALEARFPMLRGTLRDHVTKKRRAKVRFFADEEDVTHDPPDQPMPESVIRGETPFMIIGAISGG